MVCPPCQQQNHSSCPEVTRRIRITADPLLPAHLRALHLHCGQICDCQHGGAS